MKKRLILALGILFSLNTMAQTDNVVMEIDGKKVTKSEFLQIYLKNNNNPKYDKQSLDEYMELFKKFKLKVAEAEALGYDTIPKLKKELAGYRKQLSQPYLIDSTKNSALVKQAYERMKNEIHAAHILVKIAENASPEDTLAAYNRIMAIKKRIENGEDFATVAKGKNGSDDPSAVRNGGDLGYFTAFQMVYQFEEAAYNTPAGKISNPVRTKFGYHIIKVIDLRPARGTIKAAHIMVATGKEAEPEEIEAARKKVDEIYAKLQAGESFEKLASEFSDDAQTAEKGGELPLFGTGTTTRMVPEFEEAAFALKANGEISKPVQTAYGYHIVKRLDLTPLRTFDELKKEIQGKVNKDERSIVTQQSFIEKLKKSYTFKDNYSKTSKWFVQNIDTNYFKGTWTADALKTNTTMFTLDKKGFTQKEFAAYLQKNFRNYKNMEAKTLVQKQYTAWQTSEILAYEESKLDNKYPDFKALMQEYHDGILLYEIMSDKVWNKAIKDTSGLKTFFEGHNSNYTWGKRYNAYVYECLNEDIAKKVATMLKSDTISSRTVINAINKDSELNLRVRTGKFEVESTPYLKGHDLKKGVNPVYQFDGKYYIVKVDEILAPTAKTMAEAKGAATSDYQNYLEKEWLAEISKKHPIVIHEQVLYSLGK
ncbi:MAG: PpiC-type peptidyl-prolyl cis-trans isomerase [Fluviicola sp.]|uniref:peptidylprolyl isomerase n=1 Tax=Fluviicola sp. TaxID=1917219 RepID=UPI0026206B0E|nr:peptidylprolyl isomerase [Fluviicola sp.]MDF3027565.1 PpiC-type peptidyl-prolyl cis-trans isomerase [Fluviicola sp.]